MAAMLTQLIHGLCSMPLHVSAEPTTRSEDAKDGERHRGSSVNISPAAATTSKELSHGRWPPCR
jgi:hypothetical protein